MREKLLILLKEIDKTNIDFNTININISLLNKVKDILQANTLQKSKLPSEYKNLFLEWVNLFYSDEDVDDNKLFRVESELRHFFELNPETLNVLEIPFENLSIDKFLKVVISNLKNILFSFNDDFEILYEMKVGEHCYLFTSNKIFKKVKTADFKKFIEFLKEFKVKRPEQYALLMHLEEIVIQTRTSGSKKSKNISFSYYNHESNLENPYTQDIIKIIEGNFGNRQIKEHIEFEGKKIKTIFSDFEAFSICKGLKGYDSLYNKFYINNFSLKDRFMAHVLSMRLFNDKGIETIKWILSLPELPFKLENFKILFSNLDKMSKFNKNPMVRLQLNTGVKKDEIELSFRMEDSTLYQNQIRIRSKSRGINLFDIDRNGIVVPNIDKKNTHSVGNLIPVLEFFYNIVIDENGLKKAVLSYGIETGVCSVCGKKLTDKISKIKGIGPICESQI